MQDITVEAAGVHKSCLLGAIAVGALRGVDLTVRQPMHVPAARQHNRSIRRKSPA